MTTLHGARRVALYAVAAIVSLATAVAFAESYRALVIWARDHDLPSIWAAVFPAQIDVFVLVGELALFVGLTDRWAVRHRVWAWIVVAGGLAVSVAGNVGHVATHLWTDRATAAVPPLAAAVALTVGLGILKRVVAAMPETAPAADEAEAEAARAETGHLAVLAAAETDAQRIRYAARITGTQDIVPVSAWLEARGYPADPANITSVFRRAADRPKKTQPDNVTKLPSRAGGTA